MARLSAVACGLALAASGASAFLAPSMPRATAKVNAVAAPARAKVGGPSVRPSVRPCICRGWMGWGVV